MGFKDELRIQPEKQCIVRWGLENYKEVLLDVIGNRTNLYRRIEELDENTVNSFKEHLKRIEKHIRQMSTEVIDKKGMSNEMINKLKEEVIMQTLIIIVDGEQEFFYRQDKLKQKLTQIRNKELENFDRKELEDIKKMLEYALNCKELKDLEELILSDQLYYGEHSRENMQGRYMGTTVRRVEFIQKLIADYIIIYRDTSYIEEYIRHLKGFRLQEKNIDDISQIAIDFHINHMRNKYPMMDDNEIYNYIYENYETNGFLFQGINGAFFESAMKQGLTTKFSGDGISSMKKIDDIFRKYGVKNVLLSKLHEIKKDNYYYITDDFTMASHYSFHNPEYMSYLVALGPYMDDDIQFEQTAFYRRDISACLENVNKLCERYSFSDEDKGEVIEVVKKGINHMFRNEDSMKYNGIVITPKRILKNKQQIKTGNENEDIQKRLSRLLGFQRSNNYSCNIDIPKNATVVMAVESFQNKIKNVNYRSNDCKKFIYIQNEQNINEPLYYDIFIKSPDMSDLDCVVVEESQDLPTLESKRASEHPLTVDIIKCNSKLPLFDILKSNNSNDENIQPSFQSIMMMIAVNGVSNSKKGEELLKRARNKFTPQIMSQYYCFLTKKFLEISNNDTYSIHIQLATLKRIIGDLYPKAIYMQQTNRYPTDITPRHLLSTQYDFSGIEGMKNKIEKWQVDMSKRKTNRYK